MDERIEELFPLYALGALSDEERAQVDAYVAANPGAQARLAELVDAATAVPFDVTLVEPSPRIKQALMDRVRADARVRFPSARRPAPPALSRFLGTLRSPMPLLAGASLGVAVVAVAWAISLNGEVARLREETAALRSELLVQTEVIAQISAPGVQVMTIAGTEHQPAAHGQLLADPNSRSAVLVVAGLAPLPDGQVYQFWLIRGDVPVSAGTFEVDEQGRAVLPVRSADAVSSFDAMALSIEPEGGSEQPTGDIVMLSSLS